MVALNSSERDRRWQLTRNFMKERDLDALVVVGSRHAEPVDRYLSNWVPGCTVVFPLEGDPTLLVAMAPDMLNLRPDSPEEDCPWIEDVRAGARGALIVAVIKEKGLEGGRIGVVGTGPLRTDWEGWTPYGTWNRVVTRLPECVFEDVTDAFCRLTLVRSADELECFRRASQALEEACDAMYKVVRPGASEKDVYAAVYRVLADHGVHIPMFILRSGPDNVSWGEPHWLFGVGSPRVFQPGDIVQAEIFARYGGIEAQVQMSVAIPPLPQAVLDCAELARKAYEVGVENCRPGKTFGEVVEAMEGVLLEDPRVFTVTPLIHTMNPMSCIGPTGVRIELMKGHEVYRQLGTGRIRGAEVVLKPGMTVEVEPNACIEHYRVNIGGNVIVTANGPEALNEIPTAMRVVGEG